jgi:hypothetical protein
MIEQAVRHRPEAPGAASVLLWAGLATELSLIIGARGFESLFSRSLILAGAKFPWLLQRPQQAAGDPFELLASSLHARDPAEAQAASAALLNIFTDTLILLIGELLTNSILHKAWGDALVPNAGTEHRT